MTLIVSKSIDISEAIDSVWNVVADIERAADHISGIKAIEIIERPEGSGLTGLKWMETREWMGKDAVEVMWISESDKPAYYTARAESHGCAYRSTLRLEPIAGGTRLSMDFDCEPLTFAAKLMWTLTGWMAKKALAKTVAQDLSDIKEAIEKSDNPLL